MSSTRYYLKTAQDRVTISLENGTLIANILVIVIIIIIIITIIIIIIFV